MRYTIRLNRYLIPGLLCLPVLLKAQGTEKALEALFYALLLLGIWVLLGLIILFSLAKRHSSKKLALAGYVYVILNFLFGLFFAWKGNGGSYSIQNHYHDLSSSFLTGSFFFTLLLLAAQRKWKNELRSEASIESAEDAAKHKSLGWVRFWILLYLISSLFSELMNFVSLCSQEYDMPFRLYLTFCLQFLILVCASYGFWKKTVLGWIFIVFSAAWYLIVGIYQLFNLLFVHPNVDQIPLSLYLRILMAVLICVAILFLSRRPVLLEDFKVESGKSKKLFWFAIGTALLLGLLNFFFNYSF